MVKKELASISKLVKIKLHTQKWSLFWFSLIAFILCAVGVFIVVIGIINHNEPGFAHHSINDFSNTFFYGIVLLCTIFMFLYRYTNKYYNVFPQSNTGRFASNLVYNYVWVFLLCFAALAIYLLSYGAIMLFSAFREDVYFALVFDIRFVLVGFLAYVLYCFLAVAAIEFIGVVLRKWRLYAAVVLTALVASSVYGASSVVFQRGVGMLSILTDEPSFVLFALKAAGIWIFITALSLLINRCTVHYKTHDPAQTRNTAIICVALAVAIIATPQIFERTRIDADDVVPHVAGTHDVDDFITRFFEYADEILIDISHLPRGTDINLITNIFDGDRSFAGNIDEDMWAGGGLVVTGVRQRAFVGGRDSLENIQGDTLVIRFRPPWHLVNGIEVMHHINPRLYVRLEGENLYMAYEFNRANVVSIPIWSIAGQFGDFRERGVVSRYWLTRSGGGNMSANISISVR